MGAFAEFERSLIRERQREGIALARKAGAFKGRKSRFSAEQIAEFRSRVEAGESKSKLAVTYGVTRMTIYSLIKSVKPTAA
jgi:DNA invertase Pin-like site-specific DNA recombinase